jgi:hypothetical protein
MKAATCFLLIAVSMYGTSAFADGWACYTQNRTNGSSGRWSARTQSEAARGGLDACEAGGRYSCVLVKCVPAASPQDDGCPECKRAR